ncbi:hypothetical protein [Rahnella contaminans]|uniref:hypothetical protein n=1 Tax=Rahnella contaminans TaxID=2703882 RepID=UPI0023DB83AF|nr:hypothetical protein [Rahnella contaminans]MDF1893866.1 hypothetical protein [Rahnella contaminans]
MNITFLGCQKEYEEWYILLINAGVDDFPSLLNPQEIEAALAENMPVAFPCMAYIQKNETNYLDEEIVYVYEEEFSKWMHLMGADKR